jgi:uncharacterized protein (TIGR03437 family)
VPIDLGAGTDQVILVLFGTGFRFSQSPATASAQIGGQPADIIYLGPELVFDGLDQANIRIPQSLRGRGVVPVTLTIDGLITNPVTIDVQ